MKPTLLLLLTIFSFAFTVSSQTLDHKYTPYLYLGAPKSVLIKLVVEQAKSFYRADVGGVIKKQRAKGVNLKKKGALEPFLQMMEADMTQKLTASDYWYDSNVDFSRWIFSEEELVGAGFNLPGFTDAKTDMSVVETAAVSFKNNKVSGIYKTLQVTDLWTTKAYSYNNQVLQMIHQKVLQFYGSKFTTRTQSGESFLGERPFPAHTITYTFDNSKMTYHMKFSFGPYGQQDKAGNWRHLGTSWQTLNVTASLK